MALRKSVKAKKIFLATLLVVTLFGGVVLVEVEVRKGRGVLRVWDGWERAVIDNGIDGAHNLVAFDMDNNGKVDLAFAAYRADNIGWYENLGHPNRPENWVKYTIDSRVGGSSYGAHYIVVADVNKDGRPDLVVAGGNGHALLWYEAPGNPRDVFDWKKNIIDVLPGNSCPYSLDVSDIDRDGLVDVACTDKWEHKVIWYKNCGSNKWKKHVIDEQLQGAFNVKIADINRDGCPDLIATGTYGNEICWYRAQDDPGDTSRWKKITLWKAERSKLLGFAARKLRPARLRPYIKKMIKNGPGPLEVCGISGNGAIDIVVGMQGSNKVVWLENPYPGDPEDSGLWRIHDIGPVEGPRGIAVGDIDLDGKLDIAVVGSEDDTAYWFRNRGKYNTWERHIIDNKGRDGYLDWAHSITLCDLDGDGDLDAVVAAAHGSDVKHFGGTFQGYVSPIISKKLNQRLGLRE